MPALWLTTSILSLSLATALLSLKCTGCALTMGDAEIPHTPVVGSTPPCGAAGVRIKGGWTRRRFEGRCQKGSECCLPQIRRDILPYWKPTRGLRGTKQAQGAPPFAHSWPRCATGAAGWLVPAGLGRRRNVRRLLPPKPFGARPPSRGITLPSPHRALPQEQRQRRLHPPARSRFLWHC